MQAISNDDKYDEEWEVVLQSKGKYHLSKAQALYLKQAIARGQKFVIFESFVIPINYIVEFYRVRRFLKGTHQLPESAKEVPFEPIPQEKWEKTKKEIYEKIGKAHVF